MTLYCILHESEAGKYPKRTMAFLRDASERLGIPLKEIYAAESSIFDLPKVQPDDLLYRVSDHEAARALEMLLLKDGPTTFYEDDRVGYFTFENVWTWTLLLEKAGLPIIPTVFGLPSSKKELELAAHRLGGFPLVAKAENGSHGIGVMLFESLSSLVSVADYLNVSAAPQQYIVRQFIDYTVNARIIVLGDRVLATIGYERREDDFRSNVSAGRKKAVPMTLTKDIEALAVRAVHALGLEMGGVDILLTKEGKPFIAEVNFPCDFSKAQSLTGVDIASSMVEYLKNKK